MKSRELMLLVAGLWCPSVEVCGDELRVAERAREVMGRQRGVFTRPPEVMPTRKVPDGPLLGHRVPGWPRSRGDGWSADRFVVQPGKKVVVVASVVSGEESADLLGEAKRRVAAVTEDRLAEVRMAHRAWWRRFWERSYVEIGDELIERYGYPGEVE